MLVYICESWVSLNHRGYCTVAEVNKGILSDCRGSLGAMKRKFIGLWECGIFGLPVRYTGRCQEQCVYKAWYMAAQSCFHGALLTCLSLLL